MDKHIFLDFKGFESLLELEFGILETLDEMGLEGEYQGTVRITVEYIEDEE